MLQSLVDLKTNLAKLYQKKAVRDTKHVSTLTEASVLCSHVLRCAKLLS